MYGENTKKRDGRKTRRNTRRDESADKDDHEEKRQNTRLLAISWGIVV